MKKRPSIRIFTFFVFLICIAVTSCVEDEQLEPQNLEVELLEVPSFSEALQAGETISRFNYNDGWKYAYDLGEIVLNRYKQLNPEFDGVEFSDNKVLQMLRKELTIEDQSNARVMEGATSNADREPVPKPVTPRKIAYSSFGNVYYDLVDLNRAEVARVLRNMEDDLKNAATPYYNLAENNPAYYNSRLNALMGQDRAIFGKRLNRLWKYPLSYQLYFQKCLILADTLCSNSTCSLIFCY